MSIGVILDQIDKRIVTNCQDKMIYTQGYLNNSNMTLSFVHRSYTTAYVSFCIRRIEVRNFYALFLRGSLEKFGRGDLGKMQKTKKFYV